MYQCSKKLVTYKEYCCFDHSDYLARSMFTFDVCWGSLGTSIFRNSSSAASNIRSKLSSRLSFPFLMTMLIFGAYFLIIWNGWLKCFSCNCLFNCNPVLQYHKYWRKTMVKVAAHKALLKSQQSACVNIDYL